MGAIAGLVLGLTPFLLDELVTVGATASAGEGVTAHFALWHGFVPELFVSLIVISMCTVLVLARHRVHGAMKPYDFLSPDWTLWTPQGSRPSGSAASSAVGPEVLPRAGICPSRPWL